MAWMAPILALALVLQDPAEEESPNLEPPADVPAAAIEADRDGWRLLQEYRQKYEDVDLVRKAIGRFVDAERLNSNRTFALAAYHLGIAYQYTEEFKQAKRKLERAIELNPAFQEAMLELGDTYAWLKQYDAAVGMYDRALALRCDYPAALRNKAMACMRRGDFAEAQKSLGFAVQIDPKDIVAAELKRLADNEVKGPGFAKEFREETPHFVITTDVDAKFADWIGKHIERIYAKYESIFPKQEKAKRKYRVIVFNTAKDYLAYGSPPGTGGYYQDLTGKLVFWKQAKESDTLLVLYHEAFHQFLAYYLDHAPIWFNEGHGDYFGPSVWNEKTRQIEIRTNPWRLELIRAIVAAGGHTPLPRLMQMTQRELYDPRRIGINYAQSWSMVYFFWHFENGRYGKLLQEYFRALLKDEEPREAYAATFGKVDMAAIEEEWKAFTLTLK